MFLAYLTNVRMGMISLYKMLCTNLKLKMKNVFSLSYKCKNQYD